MSAADVADVFTEIYAERHWNPVGTKSGPGSSDDATEGLRRWLPEVAARLGISSILDAACGEALWVPELPGYQGCDVVPEAIEVAATHFPHRSYFLADIRVDELPEVDAVLCRDAMMHLPLADGLAVLANLWRTNARYLLLTTFADGENEDVEPGGFYHINLSRPPFGLRHIEATPDSWRFPDKMVAVYQR